MIALKNIVDNYVHIKENCIHKRFKLFYVSPLLPHFFIFKKKISSSEQQQDMLLMDPELNKLFVTVTFDLFNKYSRCVAEFLLYSAVYSYEVWYIIK